MGDFLVALGLVFAIEGILFAAFPTLTKRALSQIMDTPDNMLRGLGIASAALGVVIVWLVRGF